MKAKRIICLTLAALLVVAAAFCLLLLFSRVDESEELLIKRSAALWHMALWPAAFMFYKFAQQPKPESPATNLMSQMLGPKLSALTEFALIACVAWFISAQVMSTEYGRLYEPEPYHTVLYPLIGI